MKIITKKLPEFLHLKSAKFKKFFQIKILFFTRKFFNFALNFTAIFTLKFKNNFAIKFTKNYALNFAKNSQRKSCEF